MSLHEIKMKIEYNCENVRGNLHNLWQAKKYCDVALTGADGKTIIQAHRLVLEASSSYFVDQIANAVGNKRIVVLEVDGDILKRLVGACYSGSLQVDENNVSSLYMGAIHLQLNDLLTAMDDYIAAYLNNSNCLHFYQLAQNYSRSVLLKATKNFISAHFIQISNQSSFLELDVKKFKSLLALEDLHVLSAEDLFRSVIKWIHHDPAGQRNDVLAELLPNFRLSSMSRMFLLEYVKPHCKTTDAEQYVNAALETQLECIPAVPTDFRREKLIAVTEKWVLSKVMEYSCILKKWIIINIIPIGLYHFSAAYSVAMNSLCFVGGFLHDPQVSDVLLWNLQTHKSRKLTSMIVPRTCAAFLSVNDGTDDNGDLFVVGGWDNKFERSTVERWSHKTQKWYLLNSMKERRCFARLIKVDNLIYCIGGSYRYKSLQSVECYNLTMDCWTTLAPLNHARNQCGVITDGGKLYVIGGGSNVIERYDTIENEWIEVCTVNGSENVATCVRHYNRILAFGTNIVLISNGNWKIWERSTELLFTHICSDILGVFSIPQ